MRNLRCAGVRHARKQSNQGDSVVPAQVGDITVSWLNEALADNAEVGTISAVEAEPIGVGVGILGEVARLKLTYEDGQSGPASMIAKCQSAHAENVFVCQMMGFYVREISFYNELAGSLDIRVPSHYVADMEEGGVPFVLLVEEITDARSIDQIEGATRDDAMKVAETIAALQAPFWNNDRVHALEWLPPMNNDLYKAAEGLAVDNWDAFVENWGDKVDAEVLGWVEQLTPKYGVMLDWWVDASPVTLAHTDCRAENYLFGGSAGDDVVTVLDFQLVTKHVGTYDIANFLGMSVTIENRRAWQDEVVKHYHDSLLANGVEGYDFEQCMRDYRYCLLQQAWGQVAVANLDPGNDRGRQLLNEFVTRAFAAAGDNNSGELLEQL